MNGADDPLYQQAVDVVRQHGLGSTSLVQWKLRISYVRAMRMLEAMVGTVIEDPPPTAKIIKDKERAA